jgi:hypothetical protein
MSILRNLVTDAYYSKQGFTHGVLACGYHQIGKLQGMRLPEFCLILPVRQALAME